MAVIGISLIVASVVWVVVRPPGWVPAWFTRWTGLLRRGLPDRPGATTAITPTIVRSDNGGSSTSVNDEKPQQQQSKDASTSGAAEGAMAPPPLPKPSLPTIQPPPPIVLDESAQDGQTTPKASAANPTQPIPSFSLQADEAPLAPAPAPLPKLAAPSMAMPPPPRPPTLSSPATSPSPGRLPAFPALNSAQRARGPLPNRNPVSGAGAGLAPPPTHSSKPSKPNRKVLLTPGHSPLDWARISGPTADLRGVPSSSPYLRVTPSMLKRQNGRKGTDAWMGLNGKVYNVSPYADYHPGGVPELLRGAGKDGTKLFGEIHPWVNYETMLSACLVGLMVEEPEGNGVSEMEKMD